jgi:hypothetical protein
MGGHTSERRSAHGSETRGASGRRIRSLFDENLHLVERFSLVDRDTLLYEFTVDDPTAYTRSWTVVMPMKRSRARLYEDACHEGNYALPNMLSATRLQERRP